MKRTLRKLSQQGDELIAEWEPTTVRRRRLEEIEREFNLLQQKGYFAADITDGRDLLIDKFDPDAEILMIPRVQGG